MTDNEIIKALDCCIKSSHFDECFENKCPLVSEKGCKVGKETLYPYALNLINRLQAENEKLINLCASKDVIINRQETLVERLYKNHEKTVSCFHGMESLYNNKCMELKVSKAEAYKEFAERLKEQKHECGCNYRKKPVYAVTEEKIDNTLKEMTEKGGVQQ